jgi:hypothetical protein
MTVAHDFLPTSRDDIIGIAGVDPDVLLETPHVTFGQLEVIGSGMNAEAFRVGGFVLKASSPFSSETVAIDRAAAMYGEQTRLQVYHGSDMPPTTTWVAPDRRLAGRFRALSLQPFIPGKTLKEHVADPEADNQAILSFLNQALRMHSETGEIADLANIEGAFRLIRTGNLVIQADSKPWLVDTNFGKIQRSKRLGPAWSRMIARGVRHGIGKIEETQS